MVVSGLDDGRVEIESLWFDDIDWIAVLLTLKSLYMLRRRPKQRRFRDSRFAFTSQR